MDVERFWKHFFLKFHSFPFEVAEKQAKTPSLNRFHNMHGVSTFPPQSNVPCQSFESESTFHYHFQYRRNVDSFSTLLYNRALGGGKVNTPCAAKRRGERERVGTSISRFDCFALQGPLTEYRPTTAAPGSGSLFGRRGERRHIGYLLQPLLWGKRFNRENQHENVVFTKREA